MSGRGFLSDRVLDKSRELFGYGINTTELRLMAYVQYVMCNERKLDIAKVSPPERKILAKWRKVGHIEGGASGLRITKEFWDILCEIIFLAYVDLEGND